LVSKDSKGKSKSSHDLIDDPTLSTETTEIDAEEVRQKLAQVGYKEILGLCNISFRCSRII
jgi:hypothetical protein